MAIYFNVFCMRDVGEIFLDVSLRSAAGDGHHMLYDYLMAVNIMMQKHKKKLMTMRLLVMMMMLIASSATQSLIGAFREWGSTSLVQRIFSTVTSQSSQSSSHIGNQVLTATQRITT